MSDDQIEKEEHSEIFKLNLLQDEEKYLTTTALIPKNLADNYSCETIEKRAFWLEEKCACKLPTIKSYSINPQRLRANIEQMIGATQVPLGIAGPLLVKGDYADGQFYVPMATTEGALIQSYTRGMMALTQSGGVQVKLLKDILHITPVFVLNNKVEALSLKTWVEKNFSFIKEEVEKRSHHGKLQEIESQILGSFLFLKFLYSTGDAMGMNMINRITQFACLLIQSHHPIKRFYLRSNLSSDKKASFSNFTQGYGKSLLVEAVLPRRVVKKYFHVTPEDFSEYNQICYLASFLAGSQGSQAQFANALAAIFIATGQDVAQIVNSSVGITMTSVSPRGDLIAQLQVPNLVVGTIGGGTGIGTQKEALGLMGCAGENKARKFAEIIAGTLLAGELSIMASLIHGDFVKIHNEKNAISKIELDLKL